MSDLRPNAKYSSCPSHVSHSAGINMAHLTSLLRFRLGAHDLPVATGRWHVDPITRQRVPRLLRACQHCASGSVGDEFHMVFECGFYNDVRSQFALLFEPFGGHNTLHTTVSAVGPHMSQFMSQDKRLVAAFIHTCWLCRCNSALPVHELSDSDIDIDSDDIFAR